MLNKDEIKAIVVLSAAVFIPAALWYVGVIGTW